MKVMKKNLKNVLVLAFSLLLVSCGSKWSTSPGLMGSNYGSCNIQSDGENVYTGTVYSDLASTNNKGSLTLQIIKGGMSPASFTASAKLVVNSTEYCCSTNGGTYILGTSYVNGVDYTLDGVNLYCYATNSYGNTGYVTLTIGESYMYMYDVAELTTDKRIQGVISLSSGQNLSSYNNEFYYMVN